MLRLAAAALLLSCLCASAAAEKRVWRVDSVVATQAGGNIVVQAKGAVQGGGWRHPRLKLAHSDAHSLVLELLAQPPAPGAVVISGLLPAIASGKFRSGRGVVSVRVMGEANDVTAQVLH